MRFDINKLTNQVTEQAMDQASKQLVELAKANVGVDTGLLRSTIRAVKIKQKEYYISHDPNMTGIGVTYNYPEAEVSDYGGIHELGRGAIDNTEKGYPLHWKKGGEDVYAYKVKAVKGKRFYKKAERQFNPDKIKIDI